MKNRILLAISGLFVVFALGVSVVHFFPSENTEAADAETKELSHVVGKAHFPLLLVTSVSALESIYKRSSEEE